MQCHQIIGYLEKGLYFLPEETFQPGGNAFFFFFYLFLTLKNTGDGGAHL